MKLYVYVALALVSWSIVLLELLDFIRLTGEASTDSFLSIQLLGILLSAIYFSFQAMSLFKLRRVKFNKQT